MATCVARHWDTLMAKNKYQTIDFNTFCMLYSMAYEPRKLNLNSTLKFLFTDIQTWLSCLLPQLLFLKLPILISITYIFQLTESAMLQIDIESLKILYGLSYKYKSFITLGIYMHSTVFNVPFGLFYTLMDEAAWRSWQKTRQAIVN